MSDPGDPARRGVMTEQVVVVGGGPTGLMLACELGLAGVRTTVLERRRQPAERSQGMGIHARTLATLASRGLAERIPDGQMFPWPRTPFALFWLDLSAVGEDNSMFVFPQWRTEQLLAERAVELGVEIRRGHEVQSLRQDENGVDLRVSGTDGAYDLRARYVVGCDGEDSRVRELTGVGFPAQGIPYYGTIADVELDSEEFTQFDSGLHPAGMFAAIPIEAGTVRLMTVEFDRERPGPVGEVDPGEVLASVERVTGKRPRLAHSPHWAVRFGNHTRLADRYREGRVFLAGDAAHVLFVSGTPGLNTGIQDAVNLGWKLAAHINGWAPPGLLDSYESERRPVGERVCLHARAQLALVYPMDRIQALREFFGELLKLGVVNRHLLEMTTAFRYPMPAQDSHPLVGEVCPQVELVTAAGSTSVAATLAGGRGVVLDLSGGTADVGVAAGWASRVDVVSAKPVEPVGAAVVVVRPDGYVGYADPGGEDTDGLRAALCHWFGAPAD
ncbi:FAD-dependent monooxygenase [Streptomyces sp. NBC_01590]